MNVMNNNPCKGCTERFRACADNCPKDARGEYGHKAWKADYHKLQAAIKEYKRSRREDFMRSETRQSFSEHTRLRHKRGFK